MRETHPQQKLHSDCLSHRATKANDCKCTCTFATFERFGFEIFTAWEWRAACAFTRRTITIEFQTSSCGNISNLLYTRWYNTYYIWIHTPHLLFRNIHEYSGYTLYHFWSTLNLWVFPISSHLLSCPLYRLPRSQAWPNGFGTRIVWSQKRSEHICSVQKLHDMIWGFHHPFLKCPNSTKLLFSRMLHWSLDDFVLYSCLHFLGRADNTHAVLNIIGLKCRDSQQSADFTLASTTFDYVQQSI